MGQLNTVRYNRQYLQTSDGSPQTIATIPTQSNKAYYVALTVVALRTDFTQGAAYTRSAAFRNNAGTVSQVGTTASGSTMEDDSTWDVTFTTSGTNILVQVTGNPGKIINWEADAMVYQVGVEPFDT